MKPRLFTATVTIKLEVVIANHHIPEKKDVITFALEALSEVGSDEGAMIEDGPREVSSIVDIPEHLEDSVPWGPIDDNPENLTVAEILSLSEPKPVEPFGEQLGLWARFVSGEPEKKFNAIVEPIEGGRRITFEPVENDRLDSSRVGVRTDMTEEGKSK